MWLSLPSKHKSKEKFYTAPTVQFYILQKRYLNKVPHLPNATTIIISRSYVMFPKWYSAAFQSENWDSAINFHYNINNKNLNITVIFI
jgi:hypothetical protein